MEIEIIEREIGNVVEIEEAIPMWKMPSVMGKDFDDLYKYLKANGDDCKEAPYARYVDIDWSVETSKGFFRILLDLLFKKWHFYAGIPLPAKLEGSDNIKAAVIQNKKYIQAMHKGPYHKVGDTYKKMYAWSKEQNLSLQGESLEFYLDDPRETDKNDLETQVLIPLA